MRDDDMMPSADESIPVADSSGMDPEVMNAIKTFLTPFIYLMVANENALILHRYKVFKSRKTQLMEIYTIEERMIFPKVIHYYNDNEEGLITLSVAIGETSARTYHGVHPRGKRLEIASLDMGDMTEVNEEPDVHQILSMGVSHSFPPMDLDSYLFYALNPPVQKMVADYINAYAPKLPQGLLPKVDRFLKLKSSMEAVNSLPHVTIDAKELVANVAYSCKSGRVKGVGMTYISQGPIDTNFSQEPEFLIYFVDEDELMSFSTDATGLPYLAQTLDISSDLERVLRDLSTVREVAIRGALVLERTLRKPPRRVINIDDQ